ncbi:MAG: DDE transposase [Actinobacteria bacterium]|nr:DDE transposase [Actinomycetota bacterium]MBL7124317.1 DDE transposase [Actinomycetota bacterium]
MYQHPLFNLEEIFDRPLRRYELFFSVLDLSLLDKGPGVGRKPINRAAILKALIFKNLRSIASLSDLSTELFERPALASVLGFEPGDRPIPVERFSCFLKDIDNKLLGQIRVSLVRKLIQLKIIKGKYLAVDSCPILANVKENNLKTSVRHRFYKDRPPKNDKDCRIGVFPTFTSNKTKVEFFWGYRNHIINDCSSELPLAEITLAANVRGTSVIIPQLDFVKDNLSLNPVAVIADSEYDSSSIIEYIVKNLGARPRISRNPRRGVPSTTKLTSSGVPICIAGFNMLSRGIFWDKAKNRKRHKFVCPIKGSKKFAKDHPYCPWFHPRFLEGTGCYRYLRVDVDESIRANIDYGSESFKRDFNKRSSSERVFSRLLSILMQKPSVIGLAATANLCTISHITVLAVAYFSSFVKEPNKIRFVKSFLPNF